MANTTKQRKRIEQGLYSRFTHPSPSLKKKWEKRRQKEGKGQDVLNQEYNEWLKEGQELKELKDNYEKRLADELWNNQAFRQDVIKARQIYLENIKLPLAEQDDNFLRKLIHELSDKYHLNHGWLLWLAHCIETGENSPNKLILYLVRKKGDKAKYISLDTYFPLPGSVYMEATIYLRMKESDTFGDYYGQQQGGGRKPDKELYNLFEQWQAVGFDPKQKRFFRESYIDSHPENSFASDDFNQAMKRYKRKHKKGRKSLAND